MNILKNKKIIISAGASGIGLATVKICLARGAYVYLCDIDTKYLNKLNKKKRVAMFCTGGIRCEKASIYLNQKGFKNVFQLKGGVLNYLKKIKKKNSLWHGECFVFGNNKTRKHDLALGSYIVCSGCRKPVSIKDKKTIKYEEGVSCPRCYDTLTNTQKTRFRMRQKQINLAKQVGKKHKFQKEF